MIGLITNDHKGSDPHTHHQPSVSEPPAHDSSLAVNRTAPRGADNHPQQAYNVISFFHDSVFYIIIAFTAKIYRRPSGQSTYSLQAVSATHGNTSSTAPHQPPQASRGTESRSQQAYDMVRCLQLCATRTS